MGTNVSEEPATSIFKGWYLSTWLHSIALQMPIVLVIPAFRISKVYNHIFISCKSRDVQVVFPRQNASLSTPKTIQVLLIQLKQKK